MRRTGILKYTWSRGTDQRRVVFKSVDISKGFQILKDDRYPIETRGPAWNKLGIRYVKPKIKNQKRTGDINQVRETNKKERSRCTLSRP